MRNIKNFNQFSSVPTDVKIKEGFWDGIFGRPTIDKAAADSLKSQGHSEVMRGAGISDEEVGDKDKLYVVFNGQKFGDENIEYASVYDTGEIPRIENGKLIIANPQWRE